METQKFDFIFKKSSKLNFDLCQRAEINIQVGLNMHHMTTSGMHCRPFEGRHLVLNMKSVLKMENTLCNIQNITKPHLEQCFYSLIVIQLRFFASAACLF